MAKSPSRLIGKVLTASCPSGAMLVGTAAGSVGVLAGQLTGMMEWPLTQAAVITGMALLGVASHGLDRWYQRRSAAQRATQCRLLEAQRAFLEQALLEQISTLPKDVRKDVLAALQITHSPRGLPIGFVDPTNAH